MKLGVREAQSTSRRRISAGNMCLLFFLVWAVSGIQSVRGADKFLLLNYSPNGFSTGLSSSNIMNYVAQKFGAANQTSELKVGVACIYMPGMRDSSSELTLLTNDLARAQSLGIPILVQVDTETWLPTSLLNWYDPLLPGYDPAKKADVEWYGWDESSAVKLSWRNWGSPFRIGPTPNFLSTNFQAYEKSVYDQFIPAVLQWYANLPVDKKGLFVGWKCGWESALNGNYRFFTNGNSYYETTNNPAWSQSYQPLGYNAAQTGGIKTNGTLTSADNAKIVGKHLTYLAKLAADAGIPRDKISVHGTVSGVAEENADALVNPYGIPGVSFYGSSTNLLRLNKPFMQAVRLAETNYAASGYGCGEFNLFTTNYATWYTWFQNALHDDADCMYQALYNYDSMYGVPSVEQAMLDVMSLHPAFITQVIAPSQVSASTEQAGNLASNVLDGDFNTRWSPQTAGTTNQWIQFDLLSAAPVGGVSIAFGFGTNRFDYFSVLLSGDSTNWTTVLTNASSSGVSTDFQTFFFPADGARYVRVVGLGNSEGSGGNSYAEIRVLVLNNDAPVAVSDVLSTLIDTAATVNVLENDFDPDNYPQTLALLSVTQPAHGTVISVSGGLNYQPASGFVGVDSFSYIISDSGLTATGMVSVTVTTPAAAGSWNADTGGDWDAPGNWSGGIIATAADMPATFSVDITANRYVNNSSSRALGRLVFNDVNTNSIGGWFVTNNLITLQTTSGTPTISVSNVSVTVGSVLGGTQGLSVQGNGTLTLAGANTCRGSLVKDGSGRLILSGANNFGPGKLASGVSTNSYGYIRLAANNALGSYTSISLSRYGNGTSGVEVDGGVAFTCDITTSGRNNPTTTGYILRSISGNNIWNGNVTITSAGVGGYGILCDAGTLMLGGTIGIASNQTSPRTFDFAGAGNITVNGVISDSMAITNMPAAVTYRGPGTMTFGGANTYSGATTVTGGILRVNGSLASGSAVTVKGAALSGSGIISGPVTITSGTLSPGTSLGTLSISNTLTLSNGCTTVMEINAQTLTSDLVCGLSNVVYEGTLSVTNLAGELAGGQTYKLFSAASSSGNFNNISPVSPGANLAWTFNPATGTLSISALPSPQVTSVRLGSSGSFTMSGVGPTGQTYRVVASTNVALALSNWTSVATGIFTNGVFSFTDGQASSYARRFYRVTTP